VVSHASSAQIAAIDKQGNTVLHHAASGDNPKTVELLIKRGVPINAVNYNRETPLWLAVKNGQPNTVVTLLKYGADRNISVGDQSLDSMAKK
jgi:ankyrin repeat protein